MTQITQIFNFFNPINLGNLWLKVFWPKMQAVVWVDTNDSLLYPYDAGKYNNESKGLTESDAQGSNSEILPIFCNFWLKTKYFGNLSKILLKALDIYKIFW
jgi:hypothetical protein